MFINYYFPLRAPGGAPRRGLPSLYCVLQFFKIPSLYPLSQFLSQPGGGENTYKKYTYFYFLWEGNFLFRLSHLPVYSSHKIYGMPVYIIYYKVSSTLLLTHNTTQEFLHITMYINYLYEFDPTQDCGYPTQEWDDHTHEWDNPMKFMWTF